MKEHYKEIAFYKKVENPFLTSEAQLWNQIEAKLHSNKKTISLYTYRKLVYDLAAVLVLCLAVGSFLRLYTTQIEAPRGGHLSQLLPDGSKVTLNAASQLTYHPFWWHLNREVHLAGEGFFEVKKGSSFKVIATHGTVEVLGTAFNVFARGNSYKVYCSEGVVKVLNAETQSSLVLQKGELAALEKTVLIKKTVPPTGQQNISWKEHKFAFSATPLSEVMAEIERQYNVHILFDEKLEKQKPYSGYFNKPMSVETTLKIISESLNLKVVKLNLDQFLIQAP